MTLSGEWEENWGRGDYAPRPPLVTRREGYCLAASGHDEEKGGNPVVDSAYARFAMPRG